MGRRILTAAVALPPLLFVVWQGGAWFAALITLAAALGAWELSRMAEGWGQRPLMSLAIVLSAGLPLSAYFIYGDFAPLPGAENLPSVIAPLALVSAAMTLFVHRTRGVLGRVLATCCVIGVVGGTLFHAIPLRSLDSWQISEGPSLLVLVEVGHVFRALDSWSAEGLSWIVFLLAVTFATDTAAYFVGRAFGSRKLAPNVSPNKTWEGAIGGFCGAVLCGVGLEAMLGLDADLPTIALMSAILGITGQLGDLYESKLKRLAGVKDSGHLFPGHGGVLDRMDSLMWNVVVLYHMVALTSGSVS